MTAVSNDTKRCINNVVQVQSYEVRACSAKRKMLNIKTFCNASDATPSVASIFTKDDISSCDDGTLLESPNRFPFLNHQTNRHRTLKDVM
jgi:hypothetical protein